MDKINEFLKENSNIEHHPVIGECPRPTKRVECSDGFSISVQANEYTYCEPRINKGWPYTKVELGFPSELDPLIEDFSECPGELETVYGYVPIEIVNELIDKHGGIVN